MKIKAGNFGTTGSAWLSADDYLVIEGAVKTRYKSDQIHNATARTQTQRGVGVLGMIIAAIILIPVFGFLFGPIGALVALVIVIAGSLYKDTTEYIDITFHDGKSLTLECTPRGIKKLIAFANPA